MGVTGRSCPIARPPATLGEYRELFNSRVGIARKNGVDELQCGEGARRECLHLHAGASVRHDFGRDFKTPGMCSDVESYVGDRERMAQGNDVGGSLGCLDAREAGRLNRVEPVRT